MRSCHFCMSSLLVSDIPNAMTADIASASIGANSGSSTKKHVISFISNATKFRSAMRWISKGTTAIWAGMACVSPPVTDLGTDDIALRICDDA